MSNILIENYRGFDIVFNPTQEKFQCIVTDENAKESTSFAAVKKFIDDYKKDNQEFSPFYVVSMPGRTSGKGRKRWKVVGVRKDGRFIAEGEDGVRTQISDYDLGSYMLDKDKNDPLFRDLYVLEENYDEARDNYLNRREAIIAEMDIVTLGDYKKTL